MNVSAETKRKLDRISEATIDCVLRGNRWRVPARASSRDDIVKKLLGLKGSKIANAHAGCKAIISEAYCSETLGLGSRLVLFTSQE